MATMIKGNTDRRTGLEFNGKEMVIRISPQGIWVKLERERWDNAVFVPYDAIYSVGSKLKAMGTASTTPKKAKRGLLSLGR